MNKGENPQECLNSHKKAFEKIQQPFMTKIIN